MLYNKGLQKITTIEYNPPACNDARIQIISYDDFVHLDAKYDIIISYLSIEHSGLGRYGDELDPFGDLKAMEQIRNKLNTNGIIIRSSGGNRFYCLECTQSIW
jgi:hypothetical protein